MYRNMRCFLTLVFGATVATLLTGCETTPLPPGTEKGPHGTIAYHMRVEASDPGAKIEVNGTMIGDAPLDIKVFGDKDGTFHDFGSYYYVVRGLPVASNQFAQTKIFMTGRAFTPQDRIPERLYFDMSQNTPTYAPNEGPGPYPYPPPGYYGYPYYYGAPYYGPGFRFYFGPYGHHYHHW